MGKNAVVITPDEYMFINPLPDNYDAMLDELHAVAGSNHIQTWGSPDLGKPYVIACPALSETQEGAFPYNPVATRLVFKDSGRSIYGNVSIIWIDDREGHYTYAGLTDEEAVLVCADLDWAYLSLMWEHNVDCPADEEPYSENCSSSDDYEEDDGEDGYVVFEAEHDDDYEAAGYEIAGIDDDDFDDYDSCYIDDICEGEEL